VVAEPGAHVRRPVREVDLYVQHLGGQVPVGERRPADRAGGRGVDVDPDATDERLEPDRRLDRPGERPRGLRGDGHSEVLMEDPAELDAGLEEQRLARGQPRAVDLLSPSHRSPPFSPAAP
jgi:hypothetical protein